MPSTIETIGRPLNSSTLLEQTVTATGATDAVRLRGNVALQITGSATAITARVQRSTRDPSKGSPNWASVDSADVTGNPSSGIAVVPFLEPAAAWWRVNVITLTGTDAVISLSGGAA